MYSYEEWGYSIAMLVYQRVSWEITAQMIEINGVFFPSKTNRKQTPLKKGRVKTQKERKFLFFLQIEAPPQHIHPKNP